MPTIRIDSWEFGGAAIGLLLDCDGADDHALVTKKVRITFQDAPHPIAEILIKADEDRPLSIDRRLLKGDSSGADFRFRTLDELKEQLDDELEMLRTQLCEQFGVLTFEASADAAAGATFFGAGAVFGAAAGASIHLTGSLYVPELLAPADGPSPLVLRLEGAASIALGTALTYQNQTSSIDVEERTWKAIVELRRDELPELDLHIDVAVFDLKWPRITLHDLSFELDLPELPQLLRLPAISTEIAWDPPPNIRIVVTDRVLSVETTQRGNATLSVGDTELVRVEEFKINSDGSKLRLDASFVRSGTITIDDDTFDPGPFTVALKGATIEYKLQIANAQLELAAVCTFPHLEIRGKDDPSLVLALHIAFDVSVNQKGEVQPDVKTLKIIQPYPLEILATVAEKAVGLVRFLASLPLPMPDAPDLPTTTILERLAELLTAAVRWLARRVGDALIGLAEAVEALLSALLKLLRQAADTVLSYVSIEILLEPGTLRLVQINLMPGHVSENAEGAIERTVLGVQLTFPKLIRPTLMLRFQPQRSAALVVWLPKDASLAITTDLWLTRSDGAQLAMPDTPIAEQDTSKFLQFTATAKSPDRLGIALASLTQGTRKAKFFRKVIQPSTEPIELTWVSTNQKYRSIRLDPGAHFEDFERDDVSFTWKIATERLLALLGKSADSDKQDDSGSPLLNQLSQYVQVSPGEGTFEGKQATIPLNVALSVAGAKVETALTIAFNLESFTARVSGAENIIIRDIAIKRKEIMGLELSLDARKLEDKDQDGRFAQFVLSLRNGDARLSLAPQARAQLAYRKVSRHGRGLVFDVDELAVSRDGLDISARITPEPVVLSGVETTFNFDSGALTVRRGKLLGARISGSGQLPRKLVGDATASVAIVLARNEKNDLIVESATGAITPGKPLVCEGTRFRFQIDELGFAFAQDDGYHFYFLLTGEASFRPGSNEFKSGLLANLAKTRIMLKKVPLAGDSRALARCIEFQVPIDPPATANLFNLFKFQLKGIGFHPASPAFGGSPAMSISGQIGFVPSGDIPNVKIDFHQLWIAPPDKGSMPRIRCDGLGVEVRAGAGTKVSAQAIAVDESTPSVYTGIEPGGSFIPSGFLAKGRLELTGWAPVRATIGFLELRQRLSDGTETAPRHAFFVFGQAEHLAQQFSVFGYPIYLQEVGFGFGYRYTLTGIAEADKAATPRALVRVLDEVSKYQGNLHEYKAWRPEFDGNRLTLALRAMFSMTSGTPPESEWDDEAEKSLPANPVLFDFVAALRSDLTLLMAGRAWLCRTYWDWTSAEDAAPWKERPMVRGYLYLSVPRQTLLARVVADGTGEVGDKPPLFDPLKKALQAARWSSTLYVAPGIYHQEFGWPYELGFTLERGKNFRLVVEGGLIIRIAEGALLYGVAFRARGFSIIGGRVGGRSLGASAEARADFAIEAKLISYVSTRRLSESFFYGLLALDVSVSLRVRIWLEFKIFRRRIHLEIGFSFGLSLSIALELVVGAQSPFIGGRARVAVGVRGFGRNLSIGVGVRFNDGYLTEARSRVARFMALGLGVDTPDPEHGLNTAPAPLPEPSRSQQAKLADQRLEQSASQQSDLGGHDIDDEAVIDDTENNEEDSGPLDPPQVTGNAIGVTNYWAIVHPTRPFQDSKESWYLVQIVPRDEATDSVASQTARTANDSLSTFYASPPDRDTFAPRATFDHRLKFKSSATLRVLNRDGTCPQTTVNTLDTRVEWRQPLGHEVPSEDLQLGHLVGQCFLNFEKTDQGLPYTDPVSRKIEAGVRTLPSDAKHAAYELQNAARSRQSLEDLRRDSAVVEERRSAFIGLVAESAAALAAIGPDSQGSWPAREESASVDCRDLGLTFWLSESQLLALFKNDKESAPEKPERWRGQFRIFTAFNRYTHGWGDPETGDGATQEEGIDTPGDVVLLNPTTRFFAHAQPSLADQLAEQTAQGVALDWDLEPAWGASETAFDDPEFLLKHYRIERRLIKAIGLQPRTVTVKPAAPVAYTCAARDEMSIALFRPNYQYVDDFSDLSPALRAAMLRLSGSKGAATDEEIQKAWDDVFGEDPDARVIYTVVPVDIAGTEADPTVLEYTIARPEVRLRPVKQTQLVVDYQSLPVATTPAAANSITLIVVDDEARDKLQQKYVVRVRRSTIRDGGTFGDDHVPASDRLNTDADAAIRQPEDYDFTLALAPNPPNDKRITVILRKNRLNGGLKEETFQASVYPYVPKEEDDQDSSPVRSIGTFAKALGIMEASDTLISARLFLRPFVQGPSTRRRDDLWRMVDTTIRIQKPTQAQDEAAVEPIVDVQVDRFEHPRSAAFHALDRSDLAAQAGGLIVLLPGENASIADFLDGADGDVLVPFRDAGRRSGTRLRWPAHPAVSYVDAKAGAPEPPRGLIGAFDLFSWNADALPPAGTVAERNLAIECHSQYLGRVGVLPASMRGLVPAETGELSRVEAHYPSETWRKQHRSGQRDDTQLRGGRWYTPAESMLAWPRQMLRRQLLPLPDEADISKCFAKGRPAKITAVLSLIRHDDIHTPWAVNEPELNPDEMESGKRVAAVREWLRRLTWHSSMSEPEQRQYDDVFSKDRKQFDSVTLTLKVAKTEGKTVDVIEIPIDFSGRHHPVLEEMMAEMRYYKPDSRDVPRYRRFEPVVENPPKLSSQDWIGFLDEMGPGADPYGWGVLRTFGLAACLRLYDTESGTFLSGVEVAQRAREALKQTVLPRYAVQMERGDLGIPIFELITHPQALHQISSYDGGLPPPDLENVRQELCTFIQMSLRPAPQRLISKDLGPTTRAQNLAVHYLRYSYQGKTVGSGTLEFRGATDNDTLILQFDLSRNVVGNRGRFTLTTKDVKENESLTELPELENLAERVTYGAADTVLPIPEQTVYSFAFARLIVFGKSASAPLAEIEKKLPLSDHLQLEWIQHSTEQLVDADTRFKHVRNDGPFERFAPLSAEALLLLLDGKRDKHGIQEVPAHGAWLDLYRTFAQWAPDRTESFPVLLPGETEEAVKTHTRKWEAIATRLFTWTQRFIDHTAGAELPTGDKPVIRFALATIPQPDPWRASINTDDTIDVLLLEKDRFGKRMRYAVRPVGRYEPFEEADRRSDAAANLQPPSLKGALESQQPWVEAVIDRTEPVATPLVLSARRVDVREEGPGRRLELVIARPADEILADANTGVEAGVSSRGLGLELKREFAAHSWTERLSKYTTIGSVDTTEPATAQRLTRDDFPGTAWSTSSEVADLRRRAPDLWRGAIAYSFADLPYFYRTHVLVHAAAGVVVSDQAAATFPEGQYILGWPRAPGEDPPSDPPIKPIWKVETRDDATRVLAVYLPIVRFVDCMSKAQFENWTRNSIPTVYYVPDPAVHYRISLATPAAPKVDKDAAISSEIELRPIDAEAPREDDPFFYFCEASGRQFSAPDQTATPLNPTWDAGTKHFQLRIELTGAPPQSNAAFTSPKFKWPDTWNNGSATPNTLVLTPTQIADALAHLPARAVKISVDRFTDANLADIRQRATAPAAAVAEVREKSPNGVEDETKQAIERTDALLQRLVSVQADPQGAWDALLADAMIGGTVSGDVYELTVVMPAGKPLEGLTGVGALRVTHVGQTWVSPGNPPDSFEDRERLDSVLRTEMDLAARQVLRSTLRERQIAFRRRKYEQPVNGFTLLRKPYEVAVPNWSKLEAATFDSLRLLSFDAPGQDRAALGKLMKAFEAVYSATDILELLGRFEDETDPPHGSTLSAHVPDRCRNLAELQGIPGADWDEPSTHLLRRPVTTAELTGLPTNLQQLLAQMTHEQLFGPGRYPVLQVFRALSNPLRAPISGA